MSACLFLFSSFDSETVEYALETKEVADNRNRTIKVQRKETIGAQVLGGS